MGTTADAFPALTFFSYLRLGDEFGSVPATTLSTTYNRVERQLRSKTLQPRGGVGQLITAEMHTSMTSEQTKVLSTARIHLPPPYSLRFSTLSRNFAGSWRKMLAFGDCRQEVQLRRIGLSRRIRLSAAGLLPYFFTRSQDSQLFRVPSFDMWDERGQNPLQTCFCSSELRSDSRFLVPTVR